MEVAWENGVDIDTFIGRTYNRSRLYRDDAHCRAGYQGRMCSECAKSFYRVLDGTCDKCPWWGFIVTYLAWFCIWGVTCGLLCICATGQSHFARVLVSVAQGIHVVSRFQINWPPLPMYGLRVFAIFNFSLEMLPWTCYGINMPWIDMWLLSIFIPYAVTGVCAVRYLMPYIVTTSLYFHLRRKVNHLKARFDEWPNNPVHKLLRLWARINQHPTIIWLRQRQNGRIKEESEEDERPVVSAFSRGRSRGEKTSRKGNDAYISTISTYTNAAPTTAAPTAAAAPTTAASRVYTQSGSSARRGEGGEEGRGCVGDQGQGLSAGKESGTQPATKTETETGKETPAGDRGPGLGMLAQSTPIYIRVWNATLACRGGASFVSVPRKISESCNTKHAGGNRVGGGRTEEGGKIEGVEGSGSGGVAGRGGVDGKVGEIGEGGGGEGENGGVEVDETEGKFARRDPGTQTMTQTETETGEGGGKGGQVYGRLAQSVRGVWNALACRAQVSVIKLRSDGVEGQHPEEGEGGGWRAEGRGEEEVEEEGLRMEAQLTGRPGASGKLNTLLQNNNISCGTTISCGTIQIGRSGEVGNLQ